MTTFAPLSQQAAVARTMLAQLSSMLTHSGLHIDNAPTFLRAHYGDFSVIIAMRQAGEHGKMYLAVQRTPVTDRSTKRFFFRNGTYNLTGIYNAVVQPFTAWRDGRAQQAQQDGRMKLTYSPNPERGMFQIMDGQTRIGFAYKAADARLLAAAPDLLAALQDAVRSQPADTQTKWVLWAKQAITSAGGAA